MCVLKVEEGCGWLSQCPRVRAGPTQRSQSPPAETNRGCSFCCHQNPTQHPPQMQPSISPAGRPPLPQAPWLPLQSGTRTGLFSQHRRHRTDTRASRGDPESRASGVRTSSPRALHFLSPTPHSTARSPRL